MSENNLNMGGSKLTSKNKSNLKVSLKKLDNFLIDCDNISLIKIDIEGHEIEALKGAEKIIKKNKPIIIFEQQENAFINGSSTIINFFKMPRLQFVWNYK